MISQTVLCLLVLCTAASAYNGQYGLNAFQRPTLANLFNVKPRVRVLSNKPQMQQQMQGQEMQRQEMQRPQSEEMVNTCQIGMVEPIHEGEIVTETYCRCPSGTYGLTCKENFNNPCNYEGAQYYPADPSIGSNYFIECNWNTPYLFKCPGGLFWNQELLTCDWEHQRSYQQAQTPAYQSYQQAQSPAYQSYEQAPTVATPVFVAPTPAYQAPTVATPVFVAPTPAYQAPTVATPVFVAPTPAYRPYEQAPTVAAPVFVAPTPAYRPYEQAPTVAAPVFVAPTPAYQAPTPGYMRYAPRNY